MNGNYVPKRIHREQHWLTGKTGMGLLLVLLGGAILFFKPDMQEYATGMITAGAMSLGVGLGHKAIK